MAEDLRLSPLELSALLCSKVCHDVINPVGAIANGLEVLEDEADEQMREVALDLIKKSAGQASARLQFARIAFGAASSSGKHIDIADAETLARGFLDSDRVELTWSAPRALLHKDQIRLLLNLFLIALRALPRGGKIDVVVGPDPEAPDFTFTCSGLGVRIPGDAASFFAGGEDQADIDAHSIQHYYAALIASACRMAVQFSQDGEFVLIRAQPEAS